MADSGQQPTAGSEVHTLVNDIFDMTSDMQLRKIDIGSLGQYFTILLHEVPSLPPEVSAERMRTGKFMSLLQKTVQNDSNAAASLIVRPRQRPLATHGEVEGEVEGEQPGGVYRGASADARVCNVRETKAKCEAIRAFGLVYIREQLAAGGAAQRRVTSPSLRGVCRGKNLGMDIQNEILGFCLPQARCSGRRCFDVPDWRGQSHLQHN